MDLDDIDWKIIRLLHQDGRKTFRELGKAVGFTGLGAKKRVNRLLEQGVLRVSALVNTEVLDYCLAMILLEMESAEAMRKTMERAHSLPVALRQAPPKPFSPPAAR